MSQKTRKILVLKFSENSKKSKLALKICYFNEITVNYFSSFQKSKVIVVMLGIALLGNFFMMGLVDYFNFIFDQVAGVGQN